jgi:hypothetical protein
MKIYLVTKQEDIEKDIHTKQECEELVALIEQNVTEEDFVSGVISEPEGDARFASLAGFLRALRFYEA